MSAAIPHIFDGNVRDKWRLYWRRRAVFFAVMGSAAAITVLVALFTPPKYRSTSTILIEQQEIPKEMVRSTISSFADQRVQVIQERVMRAKNLMALIDRYDLYPDLQDKAPREVILDRMKKDTALHMVSADVIDPNSGRPEQANIAFSVSYEHRSPTLALNVANELTSLYLNENLTDRAQMAEETSSFLSEQAKEERSHIDELARRLVTFKETHSQELPELAQLNVQMAERTEIDLSDTRNRVAALDSQRISLQAELAQISPSAVVFSDNGQRVFSASDRLKDLKSKLASYKAMYGPEHPDVISTQLQISGLEKEVRAEDGTSDRVRQLAAAKAELASDLEKYSQEHPDVIRLKREIEDLENEVKNDASASTQQTAQEHPDNPAFLQVKGELDSVTMERDTEIKKQNDLRAKLDSYDRRMASSPDVARQYQEMTHDLDAAQTKYQEILSKQTEAQVAENMESERKGERFTLLEPPQLPERPVSPNIPLILVAGLALSVALGFGAVIARETLDSSVRGPADIRQLLQVPTLASIPRIWTLYDQRRQRRLTLFVSAGSVAAVLLIIVSVHFFVRPLDVLWLGLVRRIGI